MFNTYAYNARRELQTAVMYRGDTPSATPAAADELPARRFEYSYDSIGNRVTAGATGQANTGDDEYTANALNQYTARENNTVKVLGTADAAATVAGAGAPSTTKKDRAWGADLVTEDHRHIFALNGQTRVPVCFRWSAKGSGLALICVGRNREFSVRGWRGRRWSWSRFSFSCR